MWKGKMEALGRILIVLYFCYGVVNGLDCIFCSWDAVNATVDDDCLGAPYKAQVKSCPTNDNPGLRYECQTNAVFDVSGGSMTLERLERKCDLRHSRCNNACAEDSPDCWQCCRDNDKCNSFPFRGNVVVTSSASLIGLKIFNAIVLFTISYLFTIFT